MAAKVAPLNTKEVRSSPETPAAYLPVTNTAVKCVSFNWTRANPVYILEKDKATHKGNNENPYSAVIGDLELKPKTGKYYFEYRINTDNCRIGFCTRAAFGTGDKLDNTPIGAASADAGEDASTTPTFLQTIGAVPKNERTVVAHMEVQTAKGYVNGVFKKQLWRLFVASSGAYFGFVVDTDLGVVQLFVDKVYQGLLFEEGSGLKGATLYPCVGIAGMDMHNHNIGSGNLNVKVSRITSFDGIY